MFGGPWEDIVVSGRNAGGAQPGDAVGEGGRGVLAAHGGSAAGPMGLHHVTQAAADGVRRVLREHKLAALVTQHSFLPASQSRDSGGYALSSHPALPLKKWIFRDALLQYFACIACPMIHSFIFIAAS